MNQDKKTPLWRNMSFTLLWTSAAASGFSDRVVMTAALALLGGLSDKGADTTALDGLITVCFLIPFMFIPMPAGWLADRFSRKWLMLGCDEARAIILITACLLLPLGLATEALEIGSRWTAFAGVFSIGAAAAAFAPPRNAIVPEIVPTTQLQSANSIVLSISVIAALIGMKGAAALIDVENIDTVRRALLTAACCFCISGAFFAFMKPRKAHKQEDSTNKISGWKYLKDHPRIWSLILLDAMTWAVAALVFLSAPAIGKLHALEGNILLDHMTHARIFLGGGMFTGAIIAAIVRTRHHTMIIAYVGLTLCGLSCAALALTPPISLEYGLFFFIGASGNFALICIISLMQSITANFVRGRVMGLFSVLSNASMLLINALVGLSAIPAFANQEWGLTLKEMPIAADNWILKALLIGGPLLASFSFFQVFRLLFKGNFHNNLSNSLANINTFICRSWHGTQYINRHHVPGEGKAIIASNHPSALDPFLLQGGIQRLIHWLMVDKYQLKALQPLWHATQPIVFKDNNSSAAALKACIKALESEKLIGVFPEGVLQRDSRQIQDLQAGIIFLAKKQNAPIVPCWVHGMRRHKHWLIPVLSPSTCTVTYGDPWVIPADMKTENALAELRMRMLSLKDSIAEDRLRYPDGDIANQTNAA